MILFDDASEMTEFSSLAPLSFNPSALILFGDTFQKPKVELELSSKYNISMFKRLIDANQRFVINLKNQHRYYAPISRILNTFFYERNLLSHRRQHQNSIGDFSVYLLAQDTFGFGVIEQMLNRNTQNVSYGFHTTKNDFEDLRSRLR